MSVERRNQNESEALGTRTGWVGVPVAWASADEAKFAPEVIQRRGRSAQLLMNAVEVAWLTLHPNAGVTAAVTRSLNFTTEAKQE